MEIERSNKIKFKIYIYKRINFEINCITSKIPLSRKVSVYNSIILRDIFNLNFIWLRFFTRYNYIPTYISIKSLQSVNSLARFPDINLYKISGKSYRFADKQRGRGKPVKSFKNSTPRFIFKTQQPFNQPTPDIDTLLFDSRKTHELE